MTWMSSGESEDRSAVGTIESVFVVRWAGLGTAGRTVHCGITSVGAAITTLGVLDCLDLGVGAYVLGR